MSVSPFHLRLASSKDAPVTARRAVARHDGVAPSMRGDLELLVSEVVTNAVRHSACKEVEVQATFAPGEVRVEVLDGGDIVPAPRKPGADGGFGLHIVAAVAAEWGSGPGRLWFVLR